MPIGRKQERELFARVLEILNRYDLSGLEPGSLDGAPIDEYFTEARAIESALINGGRVTYSDIREVWANWLSDDLIWLPEATGTALVDELNAARGAIG